MGTLDWEGERVIVVPVEALCELQRGAESQGEGFAHELVAAAGFAMGEATARRLGNEGRAAEALVVACCRAAAAFGLGELHPARVDLAERVLEVEARGSPFASAFAPAEGASCPFLRGFVTGMAQAIFGVGVAGEEVGCAATGAPECRFRSKAVAITEEGGWSW